MVFLMPIICCDLITDLEKFFFKIILAKIKILIQGFRVHMSENLHLMHRYVSTQNYSWKYVHYQEEIKSLQP